jgi:exodeoxyribonuclease V gamma subunit
MEELARALAMVVREPSGSTFEPELIVVQSKGIERWLGLELSRALGIWANARFPFPRAFVDELLDAVLEEPSELAQRWSRESLTWSIAKALPDLGKSPLFSAVARHISDDPRGTRRLELAGRIAHVFDQYAVYRPELVLDWESSSTPDQDWQQALWRALARRSGSHHLAARAVRFFERWQELGGLPSGLPRRLSVFGVSALPPIHLRLLSALATRSEVHLFVLDPSREYWAQIRSRREISSLTSSDMALASELHLAEGNRLLASLGKSGRDFQLLLESSVDYVDGGVAEHVDPTTRTLLSALQSDVVNLVLRGTGEGCAPPIALAADDRSVEIHSCHGPMREIEILRDRLLLAFAEDPTLQPHDVVVMMPDVERHAPLIDAVFGMEPGSDQYIPYRIADRSERADSEVAAALLGLLEVLTGRLKASEVLDLLHLEPVRARFGISAERFRGWSGWCATRGALGRRRTGPARCQINRRSRKHLALRAESLVARLGLPSNGRQLFAVRSPRHVGIAGASGD